MTSGVLNALQKHIADSAVQQAAILQKKDQVPFVRVPAPPDGLCAYHSIIGSLTFPCWGKISRSPTGFAINGRIEQAEAAAAKRLREYALESTPENDPIIAEQALEAMKGYTVDVGELSWLGQSLGMALRCTISQEATGWDNKLTLNVFKM